MSFQRLLLGSVAAIVLVGSATAGYAQETAATIRGVVTGPSGEPIAGVQVTITHVPSGTRLTETTNSAGVFDAPGLRVGGPYTVELTASNYQGAKQENIFTKLGGVYEADFSLKAVEAAAEQIVVTGTRTNAELKTGPRTTISAEQIAVLPTVSRDAKDFVRIDPYVNVDPAQGDSINFAGQRGRANSFTVDNVRLNDDFGLNTQNTGYPTLRPPISNEAIASLAVNVAPYSVEYDKFTGGNVNIVTKSGTNDFHGGAFYEYSDTNLRNDHVRQSLPVPGGHKAVYVNQPFLDHTWGGDLGGPIWPDRAFFFTDYNRFSERQPVTAGPVDGVAGIRTNNITTALVNQVVGLANSNLGFDYDTKHPIVGSALQEHDINSLVKLDVNILPGQRFVGTYLRDLNALPQDGLGSSSTRLDLASNYYTLGARLESYNYQLFSHWTDNFSTELTYTFKHVKQLQQAVAGVSSAPVNGDDPAFPGQVTIQFPGAAGTSNSDLVFGPDRSRHANNLWNTDAFYKGKATYTWGKHTFLAGYEREEYTAANIFLQDAEGSYGFGDTGSGATFQTGLQNFQNGLITSIAFANARADYNGDGVINKFDSIAQWGYQLNSVYGQDTWALTDELTVVGGLRYNWFQQSERPLLNTFFQSRYGYGNNVNLDGLDIVMPRAAFNWKHGNTEINGGFGLFSGGGPNVWISNPFSNDGVRTASVTCSRNTSTNAPQGSALCPIGVATQVLSITYPSNAMYDVNPLIENLVTAVAQNPSNSTNNVSPDFEIPSQWRASVELTHALYFDNMPNPLVLRAGLLYSKVKSESAWRDLRSGHQIGTAPDGRPIYYRAIDIAGTPSRQTLTGATAQDTGNDIELYSTHEGHALVWTLGASKSFDNGFDLDFNYTNTTAVEAQPALSSVAFSSWSNRATSDQNLDVAATANNEVKNSFKGTASWHHAFFGDNKTTFALFAEFRTGYPFSLTFSPVSFVGANNTTTTSCTNTTGTGTSACNLVYFGDGGSNTRELFYVPTGPNDPKVQYVNSTTGVTAAQTQQALDAFINSFQGISQYRGRILPRNAVTNPDVFRVDLHFSQEFPAFFPGGAKVLGYVDVRNLLNLMNNQWGLVKAVDFPSVAPLVDVSVDPATNTYRYSNFRTPTYVFNSNSSFSSKSRSQWQIKIGAAYNF